MLILFMLLADDTRWIKGTLAADKHGVPCSIMEGVKFSILGALLRLEIQFQIDIKPLVVRLENETGESLGYWNDKDETKYYHVRKLLEGMLINDGMVKLPIASLRFRKKR